MRSKRTKRLLREDPQRQDVVATRRRYCVSHAETILRVGETTRKNTKNPDRKKVLEENLERCAYSRSQVPEQEKELQKKESPSIIVSY